MKKKEEELKSREDEETRRQVWNSSIGLGFLRKTYRLRCCEVTSFCMQSKKANGREEREGKNIILAVCTDLLIKTFSLIPLSLPLTFVSLVRFFNCMQNDVTSQRPESFPKKSQTCTTGTVWYGKCLIFFHKFHYAWIKGLKT